MIAPTTRDFRVKSVHAKLHLLQHRPLTGGDWRLYAAIGSYIKAVEEMNYLLELDHYLTYAIDGEVPHATVH